MATLHPPPAIAAAAHGDIETAHDASADDLLLILSFAAFLFHAVATMRTPLRQWNDDPFIHARRDRAAGVPAVVATGFAARALRINFWVAPRMRRGLTLAGAQGGFQFPPQPLSLPSQALVLLP